MKIEISDHLFGRAQALAVPLIDTTESVLERAITCLERHGGSSASPTLSSPADQKEFSPHTPPILTHTKVDSCTFEGERLPNQHLYWNHIMRMSLDAAVAKGYTGRRLLDLMVVPAIFGTKTDEGYSHFPEAGISIQGQDSIGAWRQIAHFAHALGLKIEVKFHWTENPKSPHPGQKGMFRID
jgi:hypothetical protein